MPLSLNTLTASTYIGGTDIDYPTSLGFDSLGNIFITGYTQSKDFPVTSGGYNGEYNGSTDGFVTLIKSDLSTNLSTTYLGGFSADYIWGSTYANGTLYIVGDTMTSKDLGFPISLNALDNIFSNGEGFIASFSGIDTTTPISSPIDVSFEIPIVELGETVNIELNGELPDQIISTFTRVEDGQNLTLVPSLRYYSLGKTYLRYSTSNFQVGNYQLTISDVSGTVLAESNDSFGIVAPAVVYKLIPGSEAVKRGVPASIKVYPGLYAFDALKSGKYSLQWKTSTGIVVKPTVLSGPYPTSGFSLFLTYQYDTAFLRVGTYTVSLIETRPGNVLASTVMTITN
jgi:hypothetical protein